METTRLITRPLLLRFVSIVGSATSFYLLLSAVPLYAGGSAAGLVTGALMLATVAGELATARLLARYGYRKVTAAGLLLLGLPALALTVSANVVLITAVCMIRGLGFAVITVAGGALTASLIPPERRGEGLALVGVVACVPATVALPLGVWLAEHVGFGAVFVAGAVASLVALAVVPCLPDLARPDRAAGGRRHADGVFAGLRNPGLARPAAVFATTAMAAGIVVTFLPLAAAGVSGGVVALGLFVQSATMTGARWLAGRYGDRHGAARLVGPGLLASAAGILVLAVAAVAGPVAVVAGAALFGIGFGVSQNATLTLMYQRVPATGYGTVSALWNTAYDAGMGVGAGGFGLVAAGTGNPAAFALTGVLMLAALAPAGRDRAGARRPAPVTDLPAPAALEAAAA